MENRSVMGGRALRSVFFVIAFFFVVSSFYFVANAAEEDGNLPVVARWVNGSAVTGEGVYLSDTWAVDGTGMSDKGYVLLDQDCKEVLRVANYPEDIEGGNSEPCTQYLLSLSLTPPEGSEGSIVITIENPVAEYTFTLVEREGFSLEKLVYPGTYEITDVEVTSDLSGTYSVDNYREIEVLNSDVSLMLNIVGNVFGGEGTGETSATDDGSVVITGPGSDNESGGALSSEDSKELLYDTIKLAVVVVILLSVYAVVKYRREKSEEIKR